MEIYEENNILFDDIAHDGNAVTYHRLQKR